MKKILLTSGSSFSTDCLVSTDDPTENLNFPKWPLILANKLDYELINNSKVGASNLYIYDHLMENILKYDQSIGLVVAAWSYGFKTSIFRNCELNFINLDDQDTTDPTIIQAATSIKDKLLSDDLIVSSIEQTLRLMIYIQDTCDSKNITCIHYPLLNIFKTNFPTYRHFEVLEQLQALDTFQKIQTFTNIIGWPCDRYLGGNTYSTLHSAHVVSSKDCHPNAHGQKIIAQEIYNKYLQT
jgi:hypothetical protein